MCTSKAGASSTPVPNTRKADHAQGDAKDENDDDADEQDDGHTLQHFAEAAKQRGNILFQQAHYQEAISLYTVSTFMLLCEYLHAAL